MDLYCPNCEENLGKEGENPLQAMKRIPKFKIGDGVKILSHPKWFGVIADVPSNEPKNQEIEDGEFIYYVEVEKPGRIPNMITSYDYKETELTEIL